ncbi:lantibiotic dehydratase family protein [Kitasatospora sp. NBC_01287]|uniref:lantibiotic dehydratase n=1 Tax=Kitasatospora sp. NBC_01287 TaxID=2903573 RepID=UPI00225A52BA|nr:lantibiotic dehydratase [Kitasatospora sp. NBC_01287]MCX4743973.1 lantibiotic dehydratase family protein [Kitasatospora sp. NBC_01287]
MTPVSHPPAAAPASAPRPGSAGDSPGPAGLADTVMLRINPLAGRRLGSPELTAAVGALVTAERLCAALGDAARAELFDLAATAAGRDLQRILELKRAVYNQRAPRASATGRAWPAATGAWLAARQRGDLARSVLTTGYETCLAQERAVLAEIIGAEPFQLSLALGSPQVLAAVRRYARSAGHPSKQDRKSERGILQHLARAMVRTSPLARFTAVGFASWAERGTALDRVVFQRRRAHSFASVDRALFSPLAEGLLPAGGTPGEAAAGGSGTAATVMRNPSIRTTPDAVRFRHRDGAQIRVLSTPLTAQLRILLDLTALGPVATGELEQALAARLGGTPQEAGRMVRAARDAQILLPGPVLDEQAADPPALARELLRECAPDAAGELARVSSSLGRLPTATVPERVALLNRLESAQRRLNALGTRPGRLRVNEDYVLDPFEVSAAGYRQALDDLAGAVEFAALFDRHHELRALACTLFVDRFGSGAAVPLVDHAAGLVDEVLRREARFDREARIDREARTDDPVAEFGPVADFGPRDGSLARLFGLRARALRTVAERIARHRAEHPGAEELALEPGLLAELASALPERFRRSPASYGLLVQPVAGRLVLNGCYPGHGGLGTRFLGADRELGGRAAESTARRAAAFFSADGAEPREDRGLHGVNINHRIPLLERTVTPEEWLGIRLAHDPGEDELVLLDADGVRVRPVSLGMRWPDLHPAPLRLATWLADTSRVMVESFGWEAAPAAPAAPALAPERTAATPRLTTGQVVLQRRRWYPGADFPAAPGPGGPAGHLVDLTAWRAVHGVPEEVVIKTGFDPVSISRAMAAGAQPANRRPEKPQYADLASALAVRVLPRLLERRPPGGYLEEALPGVRRGRHAAEWVIELDRPAGARFQLRTP